MSVSEEAKEQTQQGSSQNPARTALTAAAAAAATGVATYAVRKAMSHNGGGDHGNGNGNEPQKKSNQQSVFASAAAGGWDAARDALVPLAEDAADAAGRYLAEHGPDFVRDRVVPRFIESFNNANG